MNMYVLPWTDFAEMRCLHTLYSTFKNVMYIGCKLAQEIEIKCIWFHVYCLLQRGYFGHRSDWLQVDVWGSMPDRSTDFSLRHHVLTDSELRVILLASCKIDDRGPFRRIKGAGGEVHYCPPSGTGPTGCCTGTFTVTPCVNITKTSRKMDIICCFYSKNIVAKNSNIN